MQKKLKYNSFTWYQQ